LEDLGNKFVSTISLRGRSNSSVATPLEVARFERVGSSARCAQPLGPSDADEIELEIDDTSIDEAALPELDTDDAEAIGQDPGYEDLIDHDRLERSAEGELDEEGAALDDIGLTIDLDGPAADDDGAQVVDLDVGSLLAPLSEASEGELELEPFARERGDVSVGIGALRDLLLPDTGEEDDRLAEHLDDREVGDDHRFPVFDDSRDIAREPSQDDDDEIGVGGPGVDESREN
jgi:hypothetical protein